MRDVFGRAKPRAAKFSRVFRTLVEARVEVEVGSPSMPPHKGVPSFVYEAQKLAIDDSTIASQYASSILRVTGCAVCSQSPLVS
jgi:hypothetical protein